MTQEQIAAAFDAALQTLLGIGTIHLDDGSIYQPNQGTPYVVGKMSAYTRAPVGSGVGSLIQISGSYTITLVRPSIEGRAIGGKLAGQVRDTFPRGNGLAVGTSQALTIINSSEQPVLNQPDWMHFPVVVSFLASDAA